jgi:apolipoprotein D and lipocalin family protein
LKKIQKNQPVSDRRFYASFRSPLTKLRVTIDNFFAKLFGSPPEYGNYWILELADDYSMALVGSPDRESLRLLSRTPEVSEDRVDQYLDAAREKGYPVNDILMHEFE